MTRIKSAPELHDSYDPSFNQRWCNPDVIFRDTPGRPSNNVPLFFCNLKRQEPACNDKAGRSSRPPCYTMHVHLMYMGFCNVKIAR
jgi:hypothetical protein